MKNPILLLSVFLFVLLLSACHRPYALVQRTPSPHFQSPQKSVTTTTSQPNGIAAELRLPEQIDSAKLVEVVHEVAVASTVSAPAATPIAHRMKRINTVLHEAATVSAGQPRPKPKSRNQLRLGNRIRESLGLPLREELNWWQRIDWKLKSAVFVVLVAVVFAIVGLGQLALIFGLIGALLLVLGLKRSFKRRRPWL